METGTVGFICTAAAHPARSAPSGTGLTVNQGKWAFNANTLGEPPAGLRR